MIEVHEHFTPTMNALISRGRFKASVRASLIVAFALLWAVSLAAQKTSVAKPATPEPPKAKAAVTVGGKPLFYVQERVLSFTPEARAAAITDRIEHLIKDPLLKIDSIATSDSDVATDIVAGDLVIMSVTDADAKAAGQSRQQLAAEYVQTIRSTIEKQRQERSWRTILMGALYAGLATLVLLGILTLLRRFYPKLYRKVRQWQGTRIRSLKLQKFELLPAERITALLVGIAKVIRAAIVVVLFYFYLSLVFSFFPWTRGYAAILLDYVLTPVRLVTHQITDYLPNLFFIAVIVVVSYYITRFVSLIFREIGKGNITFPGFYPEWADPTYKITRFLIIALTLVVVFPYLPGSRSPAFQGVSIFLGLLFSLGSSSAIANVVAGVILTYMRAFKIGDRVKIADTIGDVIEKNLLVTRVRTIKNVEITIANAMVLGSHIINFSTSASERGVVLHTSVTIGYDAPWRKVHELLLAAADATEGALKEPKPYVLQTALNDFYVSYELNVFTDHPNLMATIYSDIHEHIQDKFNEAGVEIMSPHYSSLRDGNRIAIPDPYLPPSYAASSFRVSAVDSLVKGRQTKAAEARASDSSTP